MAEVLVTESAMDCSRVTDRGTMLLPGPGLKFKVVVLALDAMLGTWDG